MGEVRSQTSWTEGGGDIFSRFEPYRYSWPYFDVWLETVRLIRPERDARVADVGDYDGGFLMYLREREAHQGEIIGIDAWNEPAVQPLDPPGKSAAYIVMRETIPQDLRERLNTKFVRAYAQDLPFSDQSVDLLTAFFMMYFVPENQQPSTIKEFKRVLKPGGVLALTTSGDFNKIRHRFFEESAARSQNVRPPNRMSASFDSQKAAGILPAHFKNVYQLSYRGHMVFKSQREAMSYYHSIMSMAEYFQPPMDEEELSRYFMQNIASVILNEIDTLGYFADYIERDVFICSDNPSGMVLHERDKDIVIKGFSRADFNGKNSYSNDARSSR